MNWQEITVRVPAVPTRELSPNGRVHWRKKHRVAQELKQITMWAMKSHYLDVLPDTPWQMNYTVAWGFGMKRWDDDNLIAGLKALRDGIVAEAGIDDKHMVTGTVNQIRDPKKQGYVEVVIRGGAR